MRTFKFRAWDGTRKSWVKDFVITPDGRTQVFLINDPKNINLMQYTGLKDRNGKEIYEGDIVQSLSQFDKFGFGEVYWYEDGSEWCWSNSGLRKYKSPFLDFGTLPQAFTYYSEGVEIIGNIYENPELFEI